MLKGGWWWKSCGRGLNGLYMDDPNDLTARQGIIGLALILEILRMSSIYFGNPKRTSNRFIYFQALCGSDGKDGIIH